MSWMYQGVAEWKALCSLSQDKRAFTCTPRAQGDVPASGGCVWHCVLKDSSGRILETGIVDVRTTYDSKPTNKCICSFSQLLPVRLSSLSLSPSSCCCSSIVARNSRFHLIMGIVRIYVMILFRIHPYPLPPRQRDDL